MLLQTLLNSRNLLLAYAQQEVLRSIWYTDYAPEPNKEMSLGDLYPAAKCSDPDLLERKVGQAANCCLLCIPADQDAGGMTVEAVLALPTLLLGDIRCTARAHHLPAWRSIQSMPELFHDSDQELRKAARNFKGQCRVYMLQLCGDLLLQPMATGLTIVLGHVVKCQVVRLLEWAGLVFGILC